VNALLAQQLHGILNMDVPRKNAKRRRYIRRSLYAATVVVVIAAATVGLSRLKPAAPTVDRRTLWLDTVKRGSMLRQVRGVGSLVSEDILLVPAAVSGRVTRILVEPGTSVDPNTVLLQLTNQELELELLDAESRLNSSRATLTAQKAGLRDQLLGMQAGLAQAEASYDEAKLRAEVDKQQFDRDLISELNMTLSKTRVEQQEGLLKIDRERLEMYRTETMPARLIELEASVRLAESNYKIKQNQVESLSVRAGTGGVLAQVPEKMEKIELGQTVAAGRILAKITDPNHLKAQLKIPEVQARDVRIGLPAEVDTYHGIVSGKVSRIDPTVIEGNVTVDISLEGQLPEGTRPDLSVVGTIEIEKLQDILYVGRPVFASSENASELFKVVDNGKFGLRTRVEFGRSSVSTIEVLKGLDKGDEIVLSDMSQWDGQERIRLK
jgi:multidrug resistance efflux pump